MHELELNTRFTSWVTSIQLAFGWEVDRQATQLNEDLPLEQRIIVLNHPTNMNASWECGSGEGHYFLHEEPCIPIRAFTRPTDGNSVECDFFDIDIRLGEGRQADIVFVDRKDGRALSTSELASLFLDRLRDANV